VDREGLLAGLCASLETWYNLLSQGTGAEIIRAYEERMSFIPGEHIGLEAAGAKIEGTFIGLDAFGGLVCEQGGRRTVHYSAEVSGLEGRK
jgi:biotin-(acetyl-CoA carboxylase) ligase